MRNMLKVMALVFVLGVSAWGQMPLSLNTKLLSRSVAVQTIIKHGDEEEDGHGTGVIIATGFVLTNYHVLNAGSIVKVNGKDASVVKVDVAHDLALLATNTGLMTPIVIAKTVTQDEEVIAVGDPLELRGTIVRGRVVNIINGNIYTDAHIFFGDSGCGVYNTKGELLGITVAIKGGDKFRYPFGVVIPTTTVFAFLSTPRSPDVTPSDFVLAPK